MTKKYKMQVKRLNIKRRMILLLLCLFMAGVTSIGIISIAASPASTGKADVYGPETEGPFGEKGLLAIGAGLAVGLACLGAGIAIASSGAATVSAATEKPETFFKNFIVVALAEALGIYGLIIGVLLWLKI